MIAKATDTLTKDVPTENEIKKISEITRASPPGRVIDKVAYETMVPKLDPVGGGGGGGGGGWE